MGWTGLSSDNWPVSEQFPVVAIQFFEMWVPSWPRILSAVSNNCVLLGSVVKLSRAHFQHPHIDTHRPPLVPGDHCASNQLEARWPPGTLGSSSSQRRQQEGPKTDKGVSVVSVAVAGEFSCTPTSVTSFGHLQAERTSSVLPVSYHPRRVPHAAHLCRSQQTRASSRRSCRLRQAPTAMRPATYVPSIYCQLPSFITDSVEQHRVTCPSPPPSVASIKHRVCVSWMLIRLLEM